MHSFDQSGLNCATVSSRPPIRFPPVQLVLGADGSIVKLETDHRAARMPEVIVRKRVRKRQGLKHKLSRWLYMNRPKLVVVLAFVAMCLVAIVAASMTLGKTDGHPADDGAASAPLT